MVRDEADEEDAEEEKAAAQDGESSESHFFSLDASLFLNAFNLAFLFTLHWVFGGGEKREDVSGAKGGGESTSRSLGDLGKTARDGRDGRARLPP
jgi:hypothetical protein